MPVTKTETLAIVEETDVVKVRQRTKALATELRFGILDQTKILTAASELGRNTLIHGRGGRAVFELLDDGCRRGLRICFEDNGPGIPDLKLALTDGYTTGNGMGLGLSGSKRLVNEFDVQTEVGVGTKVTITRWI